MEWIVAGSLAASLGGLLFYLYFFEKGQFDEEESVKYQLFREDDPD